MALIIVEFIIALIGLAATLVLFYRVPKLPERRETAGHMRSFSVIIPARNEEHNLRLLLEDLRTQSLTPLEIICVDDDSSDATAQIAKSYGVKVISLLNKPDDWTGKTWACQNGANAAAGELLIFLDADVRLEKNGIARLLQAYSDDGCTISVQPFHSTQRMYEQFSLLFNLIQIAANGTALPKPMGVGLYGPVILIPKSDYLKINGHESVRKSVVEDIALGRRLAQEGIPYKLYVSDREIAFRMYSEGFRSLIQGWVKNIASGAARTPAPVLWMVFFWVTSMISAPVHIVVFAAYKTVFLMALYSALYLIWVFALYRLSKRAGQFFVTAVVFYPILLLVFISIFFVSMFKRIFGLKVTWKGRAILGEEKMCK